jgi:tetraacyldisaccharide 4'-kinase
VCERGETLAGTPVQVAGRLVVRVCLAPVTLVRPAGACWEEVSLGLLAGRRVLAVSGVARPAPLYASLRDWEAELVHVLEYPDHHPYDVATWKQISHAAKDADLVVTTEKDLVKLDRFPFERNKLVALRLGVTVDPAETLLEHVVGEHNGASG